MFGWFERRLDPYPTTEPEQPPKGRKYTRVEREPYQGIEVHGDRNADLPKPASDGP